VWGVTQLVFDLGVMSQCIIPCSRAHNLPERAAAIGFSPEAAERHPVTIALCREKKILRLQVCPLG